ncbi:MAG: M61 family peptidase [Rhodanobacteraceae bacterium]|nr:MAG: M61 family peptidase [Rhodanobacteraceae bacterium]
MHRTARAIVFAFAVALAWAGIARAADITTPYPGTLTLRVDLTQAPRKIFSVRETIPVQAGPLTLYYPKWISGDHAPDGPITNLAGITFTANGRKLPWRRDLVDMYAIHLEVPAGTTTLDADFDFLSPRQSYILTGDVTTTRNLVDLEWNQVVLYPAGYASKAITLDPSVALPKGWQFATALQPHTGTGRGKDAQTSFTPVALDTLVDSPIIAGRYFKEVDLASGAKAPVKLDVVADAPGDLAITPKQVEQFRNLVTQENRMFASHHYESYHALLVLSDHVTPNGLEHHQSSDDRMGFADYFTDPQAWLTGSPLISHEYTHSWNGKFRRPQDLWTPDFNTVPMQGDLLWVYEGLTEYLAAVMDTRSGFWTPDEFRQSLAMTAAAMDHVPGRIWDSLQNVANTAQLEYYVPSEWGTWRRGTDFYPEGVLLWLDVDTKIRQLSHGHRSLNDFARLFYGMDNGSYATRTYAFDDVVGALNKVQPFDWTTFLRAILDSTRYHANLEGLSLGGWTLVYTDTPSEMWKAAHSAAVRSDETDLMYSMGLSIDGKGNVSDVLWDGPAFKAGLTPGMQITAVDDKVFSPKVIEDAIKGAKDSSAAIRLLVKDLGHYQTLDVDYHGGLQYPHLERVKGAPDYLDQIARPLKR